MKKLFIILPLLFFGITSKAQYYQLYYNQELQAQVTANHGVRVASEQSYQQSYEKQKNAYNEVKEKITQVVVIKNNLHSYLRNVNAGLRQARQVEYLAQDFTKLLNNMGTMLDLTANKPQYAVFITRFYERIAVQAMAAYEGVQDQVLREETDYLMDSYDRQYLLNKLHRQIGAMNGWVLHVNNYLRNAEKKPLIRHLGVFNTWYNKDKAMIERIIRNSNYIKE